MYSGSIVYTDDILSASGGQYEQFEIQTSAVTTSLSDTTNTTTIMLTEASTPPITYWQVVVKLDILQLSKMGAIEIFTATLQEQY